MSEFKNFNFPTEIQALKKRHSKDILYLTNIICLILLA